MSRLTDDNVAALPAGAEGSGVHLMAEWYGCDVAALALIDAKTLRADCLSAVFESGLNVVGDVFHQFEPHGVTGTVLLAESHLAVHTWPENGLVTIDIYVCNLSCDNNEKAHKLYVALRQYFDPAREHFAQLLRGQKRADEASKPAAVITDALKLRGKPSFIAKELHHGKN